MNFLLKTLKNYLKIKKGHLKTTTNKTSKQANNNYNQNRTANRKCSEQLGLGTSQEKLE